MRRRENREGRDKERVMEEGYRKQRVEGGRIEAKRVRAPQKKGGDGKLKEKRRAEGGEWWDEAYERRKRIEERRI